MSEDFFCSFLVCYGRIDVTLYETLQLNEVIYYKNITFSNKKAINYFVVIK